MARGGWGSQPGTRLQGKTEQKSGRYIVQSVVLALALDAVVFVILAAWVLAGPNVTLAVFAVGGVVASYRYLRKHTVNGQVYVPALAKVIGAWIVGGGILTALSVSAFRWLFQRELYAAPTRALLASFAYPWWAWALALCVSLYLAVRLGLKRTWFVAPAALIGYGLWAFDDWAMFRPMLHRLRYLAIPFAPPWVVAASVLAYVMMREQLFPNLEWTMQPLSLEEIREVGHRGLLWLRRFGVAAQAPEIREVPSRTLSYRQVRPNTSGTGTTTINGEIPYLNTLRWWRYIKRVIRDKDKPADADPVTLSEPSADGWGIKPAEYRKVMVELEDEEYPERAKVRWKDDDNHNAGRELVDWDFWMAYISTTPPPQESWHSTRTNGQLLND